MIAKRSSATATLIAAATVMREQSREDGGAGPPGAAHWCRRFLSASSRDRLLLWSVQHSLGRAWWRFAESAYLPGIVSHWMRRKWEIDRLAREAAAEGFKQLIVLGAGFDTLSFRLHDERLYERILSADHPATLTKLRSAIGTPGVPANSARCVPPCPAVELVELDLTRDDVAAQLIASRTFDAKPSTVVVMEGVLMYLPALTVAQTLRSIAAIPIPHLRLIASSMIAEPDVPVGFREQSPSVRKWLSRREEPMLWGITRSALPALLSTTGWCDARLIELADDARGNTCISGLKSEVLVVAEKDENR